MCQMIYPKKKTMRAKGRTETSSAAPGLRDLASESHRVPASIGGRTPPGARRDDHAIQPPAARVVRELAMPWSVTSILEIATMSVVERIAAVRAGLPASLLPQIAEQMSMTLDRLYGILSVPRATAIRKVTGRKTLSLPESERLLALASLANRVQDIVRESGVDGGAFNAFAWTGRWLGRPNAALGGVTPESLMDTIEGRALVAQLVEQMQSGAYA